MRRALGSYHSVVLGVAVLILVLAGDQVAIATSAGALRSRVLRLHFRQVATGDSVETNGRYVYLSPLGLSGPSDPSVLIDERTHARVAVPGGGSLGEHWLVWPACGSSTVGCGTAALTMYSLATGRSRTVVVNDPLCNVPEESCSYAAGTYWVDIAESCYHCVTTYAFQNIATGELVNPPKTGPHTVIDDDSRSLVRRLCKPLVESNRVVLQFDLDAPLGGFALAYGPQNRPPYLEHCGSHLHVRLPWAPETGNATALMRIRQRSLNGVFLKTRRQFIVPLPAALRVRTRQDPYGFVANLVLSSRTLWVTDSEDRMWTAPAPQPTK